MNADHRARLITLSVVVKDTSRKTLLSLSATSFDCSYSPITYKTYHCLRVMFWGNEKYFFSIFLCFHNSLCNNSSESLNQESARKLCNPKFWPSPCTAVGSIQDLRSGGRRFYSRLGQDSFRRIRIVITTRFLSLSLLSIVSTMVISGENGQCLEKILCEVLVKQTLGTHGLVHWPPPFT